MKFATLLFISLFLTSFLINITNALPPPSPPSAFCKKKCGERCALKGPGSRCEGYCLMCCSKCNCVPSGTSGNLNECPCYRDMKSPKTGRSKCP
ncbi:peamaclein-like [Silene latifolia]|uniref:peamaclein-like n=1 Tax=Silene latifolia TaxID=37657 RepID=UPI003D76F983